MRRLLIALFTFFIPFSSALGQQITYQPTWESINTRPIPAWYDEAKFGIFIHWGVYSVPAWGPKGKYAEWYWHDMNDHNGPTWKFHVATYGEKFKYQDFAPRFNAQMFDPDHWADIFERSGAKYVVLTSKHHEGFCLWPCPASWNWNAVDIGPHRDLAGDLALAVRAHGLKMGFYYSLYEWYNPLYHADFNRYVDEHMLPQMKDLVERYHPSILWTDGEWEHPSSDWKSTEFLAWLFNQSSVRDEIVINDRWGKETRGADGGFYTSEYGKYRGEGFEKNQLVHKWEEDQGMGASFGYNRNEDADDYKTPGQLIRLLVNAVSKGGNLLLDIGPTADGRIPVIMQERLLQIGAWLKVNGEAIYGSRPWRQTAEGDSLRYTSKGRTVYAIALKWPGRELVLDAPKAGKDTTVSLLGYAAPLVWSSKGGKLAIEMPALGLDELPNPYAYVFKLTGVE
jgi:alpha-L-fucosidase